MTVQVVFTWQNIQQWIDAYKDIDINYQNISEDILTDFNF